MKKSLIIGIIISVLFGIAPSASAYGESPELKAVIDRMNKLPTTYERRKKNLSAYRKAYNAVLFSNPYQNILNPKKNAEVHCDICPPFITDELRKDFETQINQQVEHFEKVLKLPIPDEYKPFQVHLSDQDAACKRAPIGFAGAAMIKTTPGTICFSTFRLQNLDTPQDRSRLTRTIYHELLHFVVPIDEEFMHNVADLAPPMLMLPKKHWPQICSMIRFVPPSFTLDRLCAVGFDVSTMPDFLAAYKKYVEEQIRDDRNYRVTAEDIKKLLDSWLGKDSMPALHAYYMQIRNNPESFNQSLLPPLYRNN